MEKFGRKKVLIFSMIIHAIITAIFIVLPQNKKIINSIYFLLFLTGFASCGRVNAGYYLLLEYCPIYF